MNIAPGMGHSASGGGVALDMKAAYYARLVFGISAIVAGVVALIWHDSDLWQRTHPLGMPFGAIIAWIVGLAEVAGGLGLLFAPSVRISSVVLGLVYLLYSGVVVPGMIADDKGSFVNFGEQFSLVCGAIALYATTETQAPLATILGRVARLAFGVCTVSFAWAQVAYLQYTASLVPTWIPPNQMFWTILTTVAFGVAALAILVNLQARLALRLLALMMALFGILVWIPHIVASPRDLSNWNEISTNYLMTAAAWIIAELHSF